MAERKEIGRLGEEIALGHLRRLGYRIRERNYRCPLGEIDLIAWDRGELVFIEVKTRTTTRFGLPQEAVNWEKQRRLSRLARFYLTSRSITDTNCRFDVVAVLLSEGGEPQIEVIKDAFPLQGG